MSGQVVFLRAKISYVASGSAFVMGEDTFSDPVYVSLFGFADVILDSDGVAHLAPEFWGSLSCLCSGKLHVMSDDYIIIA